MYLPVLIISATQSSGGTTPWPRAHCRPSIRPELEAHVLQVLVDRAMAVEDAVPLEVDGEAEVDDLVGAIVRGIAAEGVGDDERGRLDEVLGGVEVGE